MVDRITELRELANGYRVTVNDTATFHLSRADYAELTVTLGQSVDLEEFKQQLLLRQYPEALDRAVGLLAARARSKREMERRLLEKGYMPDTVEMVLYKLEKENLLDDAAFARAWVEARAARSLGKARILQELRLKGVADDVAREALATLDREQEGNQAVQLAQKLLRRHTEPESAEAKQKTLAAIQRRGYGYADASRALKAALQALEEDSP